MIDGKLHDQFRLDVLQGGAGTSTNMNANDVIANHALELRGHKKSFTVRARTREISIRMAFGLKPSRVFRMLLREGWNIALFGVAIGLALSFAAGKAMEGFLFGVVPYDPVTLVTVVILMSGISTLVGFLPARRASRMGSY